MLLFLHVSMRYDYSLLTKGELLYEEIKKSEA